MALRAYGTRLLVNVCTSSKTTDEHFMLSSSAQMVVLLPQEVEMVGCISITREQVFSVFLYMIATFLTVLFSTTIDYSRGSLVLKSLESLRLTGRSMKASIELR